MLNIHKLLVINIDGSFSFGWNAKLGKIHRIAMSILPPKKYL